MASIRLTPCKIRETRFVPIKGSESFDLEPRKLFELLRLIPGTGSSVSLLRQLSPCSYVGVRQSGDSATQYFLLKNQDLSNEFGWALLHRPEIEAQLIGLWRVERVEWDSKVVHEAPSKGRSEVRALGAAL